MPRYFSLAPALFVLLAVGVRAQPVPVILVDGYHLTCDGTETAAHSFGQLPNLLGSAGIQVSYLGTCPTSGPRQSIEDLAATLGRMIESTGAPQVDVISRSMGGLVVRAYLSGKQNQPGVFQPPSNPKVRKWISIATPNFGALFSGLLNGFAPDIQASELASGSRFIYDLATWNQGSDDLHGVDAIGLVGNAGGIVTMVGYSDGVVPVTSASLSFAEPDERTRVLPYCHSDNEFETLLGGGCLAPAIAKIDSSTHPTYQIIQSFLAGTNTWKTIGHSPKQDPVLSVYGGVLIGWHDRLDNFPLSAAGATTSGGSLAQGAPSIYYNDFLRAGTYTFHITEVNTPATATIALPAGRYTALTMKPGPTVALAAPAAGLPNTLALAAGSIVSIYGTDLGNSTVTVNGQPARTFYVGDQQINALIPTNVSGYSTLTVTNADGQASTHFLTAPAVPAVFTLNQSGGGAAAALLASDQSVVSASNPVHSGRYVEIFATGLDTPPPQLVVKLNGVPVSVQYAGPAPGYPGLDQVNILVPAVSSATAQTLVIDAGAIESNATTLDIAP